MGINERIYFLGWKFRGKYDKIINTRMAREAARRVYGKEGTIVVLIIAEKPSLARNIVAGIGDAEVAAVIAAGKVL